MPTTLPSTPSGPSAATGARRRRPVVLLAGLVGAAALVGCQPPTPVVPPPAEASPVEGRPIRLCDPSACLVAWDVVDSDGDGVSDADELAAGTDPHDASSVPGLEVIAELATGRRLPSFEAGRAVFEVMPAEIQAMRAEATANPLAAFPLGAERADALARVGISSKLLAEHGIDPASDGLTLGLGPEPAADAAADGERPGLRVGGIDVQLISADGGVEEEELTPLPDLYNDGIKKVEKDGDDTIITYENGHVRLLESDGHGMELDEKGNKIVWWYRNPDADDPVAEPTDEQLAAWERLGGATIRTVEGWSSPAIDDPDVGDPYATIILVDPMLATEYATVSDAPRVTTAQPEVDPNLPDPGQPAPPTGGGPGCAGVC